MSSSSVYSWFSDVSDQLRISLKEAMCTTSDGQGPDNYVVQNASFCLSKINDFVQNFVQNAFFVRIFQGLRLYFKTEIFTLISIFLC